MEIFFIILFLYIILFFISIKIKDNSIVDIFWGLGFVIIASYFYFKNQDFSLLKTLTYVLISFWGLRLAYYIGSRKLKNKKEDPRYAIWRQTWKYFYTRSFFQVFILQMLLMLLVAFPIYFIFSNTELNLYFFIFGFILAIIGLIFEVISDNQIKEYIKQNGKTNMVYTAGLYKYSRNPNYFGESLFWLGLNIIGMSISFYSIIGFIIILTLLLFVSGVPMKEKSQSKKINRQEYKEKTSIFIPWFPKK